MSQVVFDKNVVEAVTVAAEFTLFLENSAEKSREELLLVLPKLLPLLYLKGCMLPEVESGGLYMEESVTEEDYNAVRDMLAVKFGALDDYLDVFVEDMKYSDTPIKRSIAEDLADIYQPLKNFVESYKSGLNEVMTEAVALCAETFRAYWGQTLTNTLRAIHYIKYGGGCEETERYDS